MSETPGSSPEWAGSAEWRILYGSPICDHLLAYRGDVIVGPYPNGAQAIFAPGVWSNTPEGSDTEYTKTGWRLGIYLEPSPVPARLETKTIAKVVEVLADCAPDLIDFVQDKCRRTALNLAIALHPDADGHTLAGPTVQAWAENMARVREEAAEAFGTDWVSDNLYPDLEETNFLEGDGESGQ